MSANIAFLICIIILFVLLINGLWIHSILTAIGFIGVILMGESANLIGFFGRMPIKEISVYSLSTIPLFVLMAQFFMQADIVTDLFSVAFNVTRGKKGPMGAITLIIGAFLGAVSGSGVATAASMGQICVPQLTKYGYNGPLAGAVTAAGGSLSGIIPPTVILILYGTITETPIGTLFVAAVLPGLILTGSYIACNAAFLYMEQRKNPGMKKPFERIPISRLQATISVIISIIVVLVVFVGIYSGIFTPTEAAAIGSICVFIAALILRKVTWKFLCNCMFDTAKISAMVLLIIVSAKVFARFVSLSMIPRKVMVLLEPLMSTPALVMVILIAFFFILFCLLEGSAVIVMTVPILLPAIEEMNYGAVWFGVFICIAAVVGQLTPPVGMAVYAVCGVTKLEMSSTFKYGVVFAAVGAIVTGVLVILFPGLVTWLPSMMG